MIRAYRVDAIRAAEKAAMSGLADDELMQRAARGLADALAENLLKASGYSRDKPVPAPATTVATRSTQPRTCWTAESAWTSRSWTRTGSTRPR